MSETDRCTEAHGPKTSETVTHYRFEPEILLLDFRDYSRMSDEEQFRVVETLTDRLRNTIAVLTATGRASVPELAENPLIIASIPTGDGAYLILNPLFRGYGILMAGAIVNDLRLINQCCGGSLHRGIRAALHLGGCIPYVDVTRRVNFAGSGLNDCARILHADSGDEFPDNFRESNHVIASSRAADCFRELYLSRASEDHRGLLGIQFSDTFPVTDKHGLSHDVCVVAMRERFGLAPFKPVVNMSEENRWLMREIAKNHLPPRPMPQANGEITLTFRPQNTRETARGVKDA